jgi:hypothetical protein
VREIEQPAEGRTTLADLGAMVSLGVDLTEGRHAGGFIEITFGRGVRLASSSDGRQLYFVGGDQALDLGALGLEDYARDYMTIGRARQITYATKKAFHNFERADYVHDFGEESREYPTLSYDTLNGRLFLTGGAYEVKPEGITN